MRSYWTALAVAAFIAPGCRSAAAADLTALTCRDREDPGVGASLVFDLAKRRLVRSSASGPTILFDDRDIPVTVTPSTIEWEVAHNSYILDRLTLELEVLGRIYVCRLAQRQL